MVPIERFAAAEVSERKIKLINFTLNFTDETFGSRLCSNESEQQLIMKIDFFFCELQKEKLLLKV